MYEHAPCIIRTDGTIEAYPPANKKFTLDEMQTAVGGLIEYVPFWEDKDNEMYANEEGLIYGLPLNKMSQKLVGTSLVGDLLIVPKKMLG